MEGEMKRLFAAIFVLLGFMCFMGYTTISEAREIAVIWDTKSAMVNELMMGFLANLRNLAPDLKVTIYRERANMEEAKKVFHQCEDGVDGIVFLRSSGAEYLGSVTAKVPCFFGACNNPVDLGVVKNLNAPEGKVTGVTYFIPYNERFNIVRRLFPNVKSVALLVERGHPSGPIEQAGTSAECKRLGITYKEVVASNLKELLEQTRNLGPVDLIILTNTRLVMDNVTSLLTITNPNKIPIFSYADKPVKSGAVAGIAADDLKLGGMLAESVVDVIVRNKPISQIPVKLDSQPKLTINEGMMKSLGFNFPETILKEATIIR
jgi:putative tryptophan/tyrosine transport system substrate-binding protein